MTTVTIPFEQEVTVTLTDNATRKVVDVSTTTAELLRAHLGVRSMMFNALTMVGGVRWQHPTTGQLYPKGLRITLTTIHPETGEVIEFDAAPFRGM